jgi:hypothetical protein
MTIKERKFVEKQKRYYMNSHEWSIDYGKFVKSKWA